MYSFWKYCYLGWTFIDLWQYNIKYYNGWWNYIDRRTLCYWMASKYTKNVTHVEDFSSIQNLEVSSYQVKVIYEISKLNNSKSSTKWFSKQIFKNLDNRGVSKTQIEEKLSTFLATQWHFWTIRNINIVYINISVEKSLTDICRQSDWTFSIMFPGFFLENL